MKLSKRSVNRVAGELKTLLEKYNTEGLYSQLRYISNHFDGIVNCCKDIRIKIDKVVQGTSFRKPLLSTIHSQLRDVNCKKENMERSLVKIKGMVTTKTSTEDLKAALIYLLDNYDYVAYQNKELIVRTDDIFINYSNKMISFGPFDIVIDFERLPCNIEYLFICKALNPRTRSGHPHPNISSSNKLCTGDGEAALKKCIADSRIGDFVDIIQQILRTYSSDPYHDLSNWA